MNKSKCVQISLFCSLILILGACGGGGGGGTSKSSASVSSVASSVISSSSSAPASSASSTSSLVSSVANSSVVASVASSASSESSSSAPNSSSNSSSISSSSVGPISIGKFVDSAVGGIGYKTATQTGVTNSAGEYEYVEGETVTFFIGDLELPPVLARGVITPLNIAETDDANNPVVVNIARLLQSLDADGDPSNGISIPANAEAIATEVDFNVSVAAFAANSAVTTLIANSGSVTTTIISENAAVSHLDNSLDQVKQSLIGSWYFRDANGSLGEQTHIVLTFLDEDHYVIANDEPDVDDNGKDGFERGTYTWNPRTGLFQVNVSVDDNGEWGFSHPCEGEVFRFDLVENKLYLHTTSEIGETCDAADDGEINQLVLERVPSTSLLGTWSAQAEDGLVITTFMEGNHFMMLQDTPANENGKPGIERGTFTHNQETNEILFTTLVDNNLQWGFSHPCAIVESFTVQGVNELNCGPEGRNILQTAELNIDSDIFTFISEADTIAFGEEQPVAFVRIPRIDASVPGDTTIDLSGRTATSVNISSNCLDVPGSWDYSFSNSDITITGSDGWSQECVLSPTDTATITPEEISELDGEFPFHCANYPVCSINEFVRKFSGIDIDNREFAVESYFDPVKLKVTYIKHITEPNEFKWTYTEVISIH
ncbi:MAG: hypothetical protein ABW044_05130 [Cellvibrio sp.]